MSAMSMDVSKEVSPAPAKSSTVAKPPKKVRKAPSDLISFGSMDSSKIKKTRVPKKAKVLTPSEEQKLITGLASPLPTPVKPISEASDLSMMMHSASSSSAPSYLGESNTFFTGSQTSKIDRVIAAATATFNKIEERFRVLQKTQESKHNSLNVIQQSHINRIDGLSQTIQSLITAHNEASSKAT